MKLEDQCVSLDLAKRLKELGVKQRSYFDWWKDEYENYEVSNQSLVGRFSSIECSAFTVAELGEMLPERCPSYRGDGIWYSEGGRGKTEADARAAWLIYLVEHGLVKP